MRKAIPIVLALMCMSAACPDSRAGLIPITASEFAPGAQVITFETGTTALPIIPGITFLNTSPVNNPFFAGVAEFNSFGPSFGADLGK